MAYNQGFPATYQGYQPTYPMYQSYQPQPQQMQIPQQTMQVQQNDSVIMFVNGLDEANAWVVQPGKSAFLMDRNANSFYVKSVDANGMPNPIEVYDYKKRDQDNNRQEQKQAPQIDTDMFVTREEFEERIAQLMPKKQTRRISKKEVEDGESDV